MENPQEPSGALVLIVEDDATVAALITEVVEYAGYPVVVAPNGSVALALARAHWPALLITDLFMPYVDGSRLIAALHAERAPCPPTILITSAESDAWAFTGADVVLNKPFHIANLEALLARFLPRSPSAGATPLTAHPASRRMESFGSR